MSKKLKNVFFAKPDLSNVFSLFLSDDDGAIMRKPFEMNGKVYAADPYSFIRTDKENIHFVLSNENCRPNFKAVIPKINFNQVLKVEKAMFEPLKTADEYKFVGKNIECKTCEGNGQVEWEFKNYTSDFDCPICKGDGMSRRKQKVKTGNKTFGKYLVKLKDVFFSVEQFYKLVGVMDILGGNICLVSYNGKENVVLFTVGNCEILMIPLAHEMYDDLEDWEGVLNIE